MAVLDREVVLDAELQRLTTPQAEGRADGLAIVATQPSVFIPDPTFRVVYPERRVQNAILRKPWLGVVELAIARWV
ncbi:MAG: hypothetical protein K0S42_1921 [Microvirga sp.]|nr:hypothetical protein [Microvirga sp.]